MEWRLYKEKASVIQCVGIYSPVLWTVSLLLDDKPVKFAYFTHQFVICCTTKCAWWNRWEKLSLTQSKFLTNCRALVKERYLMQRIKKQWMVLGNTSIISTMSFDFLTTEHCFIYAPFRQLWCQSLGWREWRTIHQTL